MLLHVMRTDNHFDYIKDFMLDRLIESRGIIKFRRSTGWVTIGTDPIRGIKRECAANNSHTGSEHVPYFNR